MTFLQKEQLIEFRLPQNQKMIRNSNGNDESLPLWPFNRNFDLFV